MQYLQSLIDESVSAVFATVVEQIHKWAQVKFFQIHFSLFCFWEGTLRSKVTTFHLVKTERKASFRIAAFTSALTCVSYSTVN